MNLTKWFRKNLKKIMGVVAILLMIAFLMPSFLQQFQNPAQSGREVFAHFGEDQNLTSVQLARVERGQLNILATLGAAEFLRAQQDLRAFMLAEVVFPDRRRAAEFSAQLETALERNQLRISRTELNDFFEQIKNLSSPELYWVLLKAEAADAGVVVTPDEAKRLLTNLIPQLTGGYSYSAVVGAMVDRQGLPERDILQAFADLMSVLLYSQTVTANENVTTNQLAHQVKYNNETLRTEYVNFDASAFAADRPEPQETDLEEQFRKYKAFFPDRVTRENPYGFGYKLPAMVRLEYIAVNLDEVAELIEPPTEQEKEEYYQQNVEQYKYEVPVDPNNPDSGTIQKTRSYAEVADAIDRRMRTERTNTRAELILNSCRQLVEASLQDVDMASVEAEQLKELSGDYDKAADEVAADLGLKIYTGRTGMLDADDFTADRYLSRLYLTGQDKNPVTLTQIAFAVEQLGPHAARLGPFDVPPPKLYENIGPIKDYGRALLVLGRILDARQPAEPESLNQTFDKQTIRLTDTETDEKQTWSVRDAVSEDLKLLDAIPIAETTAGQFVNKVADSNDWTPAIEQLNEDYAASADPNSFVPRRFSLRERQMRRVSELDLLARQMKYAGRARARSLLAAEKRNQKRVDKFYSLLPPDKETIPNLPIVLEFKPDKSFYVIKTLTRNLATRDQYEKEKLSVAFSDETLLSYSLAFVHFNPENIKKRMDFRFVRPAAEQPQPETPGPETPAAAPPAAEQPAEQPTAGETETGEQSDE